MDTFFLALFAIRSHVVVGVLDRPLQALTEVPKSHHGLRSQSDAVRPMTLVFALACVGSPLVNLFSFLAVIGLLQAGDDFSADAIALAAKKRNHSAAVIAHRDIVDTGSSR